MIAGGTFFISLFLITLLFAIKYWEVERGRVLVPGLRARADRMALTLKAVIAWASVEAAKLPPTAALVARYGIHQAALRAARYSRALEAAAYDLADYVSHRHRFERRETKSQFLKEVSEHPLRASGAAAESAPPAEALTVEPHRSARRGGK